MAPAKKRKWNDDYVRYGFTCSRDDEGVEKAKCMICEVVLCNASLKPSKLKQHFRSKHGQTHADTDLNEFQLKRAKFDQKHLHDDALSSRKIRKWNDDYVRFGFTCLRDEEGVEKPQCMICEAVLCNENLRPSQLQKHFEAKHGSTHIKTDPSQFKGKRSSFDEKQGYDSMKPSGLQPEVVTPPPQTYHARKSNGIKKTVSHQHYRLFKILKETLVC